MLKTDGAVGTSSRLVFNYSFGHEVPQAKASIQRSSALRKHTRELELVFQRLQGRLSLGLQFWVGQLTWILEGWPLEGCHERAVARALSHRVSCEHFTDRHDHGKQLDQFVSYMLCQG